ncbi:MAG: hypothetical protein ABFD46_12290 [Armatimonadota bacterium]
MSTTATNVTHEIKIITDEDRRRYRSEVYSCARGCGCDNRPVEYWLILKNPDGSKRRRSPACREHAVRFAKSYGIALPEGDS